jgi:carboxypeptidase family protein
MNRLDTKRTAPDFRAATLALSLWALGLSGCIQGGGTDIGNALVMGTVMDEGQAVAGAKVLLMPEGYNPVVGDATGTVRTTVADEQGRFSLRDVHPGRYSLETRHPLMERMDLIPTLDVRAEETMAAAPELDAARTVLVRLPEGAAADTYVFIPGTDVYAMRADGDTTSEGRIRLRHVPRVALPVVGLGRSGGPGEVVLFEVALGAEDTVMVLE